MNKEEFLNELRLRLSGLPQEETRDRISFYSEMIDDRMEDGVPEAEAVAEIGTPEEIGQQILSDIPLSRLVREKVASGREPSSGRSRKTWKTILLIAGSVVWIPLLVAFLSVLLSLYIALWAVVISLWAVFLALAAAAVGCVPGTVWLLVTGHSLSALGTIGTAVLCAGLAILMFFACLAATRGVLKLTKKLLLKIKSAFIRKEA